MNSNGDGGRFYSGVAQKEAPAITFGAEPVSGVYLDTPGASSGWAVSKRAKKRMRIDDTKTTFYTTTETPILEMSDTGSTFTGTVNLPPGTITGPLYLSDGKATAPAYSFTNGTSSGMYLDLAASGAIKFAKGGVEHTSLLPGFLYSGTNSIVSDSSVQGGDGSFSAPSFAFGLDTDTGLYRPAVNTLNITTGGSSVASFNQTASTIFTPVTTGSNPMTTGALSSTSILSAGTLSASSIATSLVKVGDGVVATPSYTFTNDLDTGLYKPSANHLNISCGGTQVAAFGTDGASISAPFLSLPSGYVSSTAVTSTGIVTGDTFLGNEASTSLPTYSWQNTGGGSGLYYDTTNSAPAMSTGTAQSMRWKTTGTISLKSIDAGTNQMTCGGLTSTSVTSSGTLSATSISASSVTSSGTMSGTNITASGSLSGASVVSSGTLSATGISVSSVTSSGTMSGTTITASTAFNGSYLTASNLVTTDGSKNLTSSNTLSSTVLGNITKPTVTTLSSGSGTYNTPAGCTHTLVRCWGGGGGGGGVAGTAASGGGAGGGGGGAYVSKLFTGALSVSYAVGALGGGGAAGLNNGTTGGTTTFSTLSAGGGGGGTATTASAVPETIQAGGGGAGSGGDINSRGFAGGPGITFSATLAMGGWGGGAPVGGGSIGFRLGAAAGTAGNSPGGGGSGAVTLSGTSRAGGDGTAGQIVVEEYYNG